MKEFNYDIFVLSNIILEKLYCEIISCCYDYPPNKQEIPEIMYGEFELYDDYKCMYSFNFNESCDFLCRVEANKKHVSINVDCGVGKLNVETINGRKTNYKIETILYNLYTELQNKLKYITWYKSDKYCKNINKDQYKKKSKEYYNNFSNDKVFMDIPFHGYVNCFINFKTNIRIETIKRIFKSKNFCEDYE